jgi:chromosome segregation ATPase
MTDLVELLRDPSSCKSWEHADRQRERAADEIERLDAALEAAQQLAMSRGDELNAKDIEIERLRAECDALRNLLSECRDGLRWPGDLSNEFYAAMEKALGPEVES